MGWWIVAGWLAVAVALSCVWGDRARSDEMSGLPEIQDAQQDDATRAAIAFAKLSAWPRLAVDHWVQRVEGEDGLGCLDHPKRNLRLIHSIARVLDGEVWAHVSLSRRDRKLPDWEQV